MPSPLSQKLVRYGIDSRRPDDAGSRQHQMTGRLINGQIETTLWPSHFESTSPPREGLIWTRAIAIPEICVIFAAPLSGISAAFGLAKKLSVQYL